MNADVPEDREFPAEGIDKELPSGGWMYAGNTDRTEPAPEEGSGDYTVEVRNASGEAVLRWGGYADNPSDALVQAEFAREEEVAARGRGRQQ